jgi:hypothetical protein
VLHQSLKLLEAGLRRERVSVYGGELEAGPRPEGGYRLRVKLPVE